MPFGKLTLRASRQKASQENRLGVSCAIDRAPREQEQEQPGVSGGSRGPGTGEPCFDFCPSSQMFSIRKQNEDSPFTSKGRKRK